MPTMSFGIVGRQRHAGQRQRMGAVGRADGGVAADGDRQTGRVDVGLGEVQLTTATAPDIATPPALDLLLAAAAARTRARARRCPASASRSSCSVPSGCPTATAARPGSGARVLPGVVPPLAGALVPSTSVRRRMSPPPAPVPSPAPATGLETREPETARIADEALVLAADEQLAAENEPAGATRRGVVAPLADQGLVSRLTSDGHAHAHAHGLGSRRRRRPRCRPRSRRAPGSTPCPWSPRWRRAPPGVVALVTLTSTTPFTATVLACPPDAPSVTDTSSLPASTFKSFE